jgi:hypothetical protein
VKKVLKEKVEKVEKEKETVPVHPKVINNIFLSIEKFQIPSHGVWNFFTSIFSTLGSLF